MWLSSVTKPFNWTLGLSCLLIGISTFNHGFDNQAFSTTMAMDSFAKQFGVYDAMTGSYKMPPQSISLFNGLHFIGNAIGLLIGSFVSRSFGRRKCMFSMCCIALVSATLVITSKTMIQMIAARVLNYFYVGMELAVVPSFQSEITPAPVRGLIVSTYLLSMVSGGLVMNGICRITSDFETNLAWKIPMSLFYVIPTIISLGIWFVTESPRWLLMKGRDAEAEISLRKPRAGTMSDDQIAREFEDMKLVVKNMPKDSSFKECFQGSNQKRLAIVMFANFFQQGTGAAFVAQYGAIFVKSTGTLNPFDFTVWNMGTLLIMTLANMVLNDKVGRRPLIIAGSIVQVAALFTLAGLGTVAQATTATKTASVGMLCVFSPGFALGWAPLAFVITSELIDLRLREQTALLAYTVNVITNFSVNFSTPYLVDKQYLGLDARVGYIFGPIALCSLLFVYFCLPECKGKSLEEVDALFKQGVRLRDFKKHRNHVQGGVEEKEADAETQSVHVEVEKVMS